jgi:hypothetical protein
MKITNITSIFLVLTSFSFGIPEAWKSSTTYSKDDVVLYPEGSSAKNYISLQSGSGQQPDTSTAFWSLLDNVAASFTAPPGDPSTFTTPDANEVSNLANPSETNSTTPATPVAVQYGVSSRGYCGPLTGANADPLIAGFIVTDANKSVIVVASGPSLPSDLNPISDPSVYVINMSTGAIVAPGLNDNWKTSADVADITNSGRAPTNDLDSAIILRDLEPGTYSAICFGTDGSTNSTGTALIEVYEFDDGQSSGSKFEGLSTRGFCGPLSTGPRIVGFAVQGDAGTTVDLYVAAKGPSLAGAVANPISDPALYVIDMTTGQPVSPGLIDNWKDGGDKDVITSIGREPGSDADAALILRDLPPGVYSAIAYGVNDVEGTVLVEVYDVDLGN